MRDKIIMIADIKLQIDLSGLVCPLPILKTKQALQNMQAGEVLKVVTTDPHSEIDFKAFIAKSNHELCNFEITAEKKYIFMIKKKAFV